MTTTALTARPLEAPRDDARGTRSVWEYIRSTGLHAVLMGASKDPNAKVTVVLVSEETGRPSLVVKMPTSARAAEAVDSEARVLGALEVDPSSDIARTIPSVVDVLGLDGRIALVMTAVQGVPLTTTYLRPRHASALERVERDFAAAGSWLAAFQESTARTRARLNMLGGVAARLWQRFHDERDLEADLELLAAIDARLAQNIVPLTGVHGDFWFGNILVDRGGVSGVVDWESGAAEGAPTRDLVRFAHMYALYLDLRTRAGRRVPGHRGLRADRWGAAVEYALDGRGWFPDLYRAFVANGLARLGASRGAWRDAALAGIAEVAAFTDDAEFAHRHLHLFGRLARREIERKEPPCAPALP